MPKPFKVHADSKMKILVTGARGQLGRELMDLAAAAGASLTGIDLPDHDIADRAGMAALFGELQPNLVINAAAYTQVDRAESEPQAAERGNHTGPALLAEICRRHDVPMVHVSTDFVFDGRQRTPYTPDTPPAPLSVYGRTKAAGERAVGRRLHRHLIVRTAWLYRAGGTNFVTTMLRLGRERAAIRVVADQFGSPTCAADLAPALLSMGLQATERDGPWGTFHYCGEGVTSWHGFAGAVFEEARNYTDLAVTDVKAIASSEYPAAARRPAYSALDCSSTTACFGIRPRPWKTSLAETVRKLLAGPSPQPPPTDPVSQQLPRAGR